MGLSIYCLVLLCCYTGAGDGCTDGEMATNGDHVLVQQPASALRPFWRKLTRRPSYVPTWYANVGQVTTDIRFNPSQSETENGERLERALRDLSAGEHVLIHGGTYSVNKWWTIKARGTSQEPIVIRGAPSEKVVLTRPDSRKNVLDIDDTQYLVIDNVSITGGSNGLKIYNATHFLLSNSEVSNTSGAAVTANARDTSYLYFVDNEIHHTGGHGEGLYLGAHDGSKVTHHTFVIGNYIHDLTGRHVSQGDGIEVKDGSYAVTIKHNFVKNTNYPGIIVYGTGHGEKDRNIVEENVVINSDDYALQACAEAVIRNNLFVNGRGGGFLSKPERSNPQNLSVVNNTFVSGTRAIRTRGWDASDATGIVLANNAIYSRSGDHIFGGTGRALVTGNVLVKDLTTAFCGLDLTGFSLNAFPQSGSPLISSADASFLPEVDLYGFTRAPGTDSGAVAYPK